MSTTRDSVACGPRRRVFDGRPFFDLFDGVAQVDRVLFALGALDGFLVPGELELARFELVCFLDSVDRAASDLFRQVFDLRVVQTELGDARLPGGCCWSSAGA